jgi:6-phosphogluconolactonase
MTPKEQVPPIRTPRFTRRGFLEGASALATAAAVTPARAASGDVIAYVGAATNTARNTGGIYSYYLNQSDGSLTLKSALTSVLSPNYMVIHPNKKYLYAVNSIANFAGTTSGSVTALSIDEGTGDLKVINVVNAQGGGTTFISIDPTGKWAFVANYGGSNAAVLPILADGSLGNATDVVEIKGPLGTTGSPWTALSAVTTTADTMQFTRTWPAPIPTAISCLSPISEQTGSTFTSSIK